MIVAGVSDVTLGFGSSQIYALMKFISRYYEAEQTIIIEPDQADIPRRGNEFQGMTIRRLTSLSHIYSMSGRVEYILKASKLIDRIKPDVLVIFTTFCIPVLIKISFKPKFVIYYSLETVSAYGQIDVDINKRIASKLDLILFPEENRAAKFIQECGPINAPLCIIYNCTNGSETNSILPVKERNGRILHQGRLKNETGLEYLLRSEIQIYPIDLYGIIDIKDKDNVLEQLLTLLGDVKYKGSLNHQEMALIRKFYAYSLVFWQPTSENTLYACPNKFFESIADGIPPIASPHPQCKLLIERYDCGLVLNDWNFESYLSAVRDALDLYDTQKYKEMVDNCKKAVTQELNWDKQTSKITKYLKQI